MAMCELATARQQGISVKAVVLSNHTLGMVYEYQKFAMAKRYTMVELEDYPKLSGIAGAYGASYLRLEDAEEMDKVIEAFLQEENSALLEVMIDPEEGVRGGRN